MRKPLILTAAVVAALVAPAAAGAATLTEEAGTLVYRGEGSEGLNLLLSSQEADPWAGTPKMLRFGDSGADRIDIQTGLCQPTDPAYGPGAVCELSTTRPVKIEGSDARDALQVFSASDWPDSIPLQIDGRGGDDDIKDAYNGEAGRMLTGGAGNDAIKGYGGPDVIDGGDGNDEVDGGAGDDQVRGGAGADALFGDHFQTPGADLLDGGPGTDSIDEWTIPGDSVNPAVTVSLDGVANDGRPGEGDNVIGVENFTAHAGGTFVGTDAAENFDIWSNINEADSVVRGGGGDDIIKTRGYADTVDGGAGDDKVEGGLNNDTVIGGPGKDQLYGDSTGSTCDLYQCTVPFGNDIIEARDGEADQIDCGVGEDIARVDAIDTVASNCETIEKGGGAPGGPADPGTPGNAGPKAAVSGKRTIKTLLAGKLKVAVPCQAACTVSVAVKAGGTTVASGRKTALAAGTAKVALKPTARGKAKLRHARKLSATVRIAVKSATGTAKQSLKLSLRR